MRNLLNICLALFLAVLSQFSLLAGPATATSVSETQLASKGPHAPQDRQLEPTQVSSTAKTQSALVDLGNTNLGPYSMPVRGLLITPQARASTAQQARWPLIVINHLRAPNCSDNSFAYPCPSGTSERRFDLGMAYLGEELAQQGYAVLIPDLSTSWIGADVTVPYDQRQAWRQIVGRLTEAIARDAQGGSKVFGGLKTAAIDQSRVGLVVHSRSASIVNTAVDFFGSRAVRAVLAYGPAYNTFDEQHFSPDIAADLPYLSLAGDLDQDVGPSANLWLGKYLSKERTAPALVANLAGFGHMYVNRALSQEGFDDRRGCDLLDCRNEEEHEKLLISASKDWFATFIRGQKSGLPIDRDSQLPQELYGYKARWLAATTGSAVTHLSADRFKPMTAGSARTCRVADPVAPAALEDACPDPELGYTEVSPVVPVTYMKAAGAQVQFEGLSQINLHLAPFGSSPKQEDGRLVLKLVFSDGSSWSHTLAGQDSVLANRADETTNGHYLLASERIDVPDWVAHKKLVKVQLRAPGQPVLLHSLDLLN